MFLRALWGSWEGHTTPKPSYRQVALLSPDPQLYQEIRERGLNTSQESDDDILDEPSSPEGTQRADTTIVVKNYRPAQLTWSQLPEVRSPTPILHTQEAPQDFSFPHLGVAQALTDFRATGIHNLPCGAGWALLECLLPL